MTDKKQSSVTKSNDWDVYHVRAGYEWATIALKGWQATGVDKQPREIGEILIHSSYGSWAYQWGHLGQPFKQWLAACDYFLAEPWESPSTSLNRQFSAFWDTIMPVFQQALRDELASAKAAA